ncbi:MAG: SDR family oxidoreductase [Clostridia bacterium]|nr:SDR family oxidoreductase [Clostridia bacterium]MBT7122895.1 SDR family oxidoreductase [Clostridia bacterium]
MKNIVITGSTRGIGLEMARVFLQSGCNVVLSGRGETMSEQAASLHAQYSEQALYVPCNVQKQNDLENLWAVSSEAFGSVDCWINNAGQNAPYEYIWDTGEDALGAVIDTNIKGMILGCQVAARRMIAQGSGQIWNMEGLGSNGMIQSKAVLYGMTKSALTYFSKGLAKELKDTGVLVGRLSPGMMLTDFITKAPDGSPGEVYNDPHFKKVFNILADKPETVAQFLVPRMISNTKQNASIAWLTNAKAGMRFMCAPFRKDRLI